MHGCMWCGHEMYRTHTHNTHTHNTHTHHTYTHTTHVHTRTHHTCTTRSHITYPHTHWGSETTRHKFNPPPPHSIPSAPPPSASIIQYLCSAADKDRFHKFPDQTFSTLWTNRFLCAEHLCQYPRGLPLFLLSVPTWHSQALQDTLTVVDQWPLYDPTYGLELLDPQ